MIKYLNMRELKKEIIRNGKKLKLVKKYERYARYEDEKGNQQCFIYNDLGITTYQRNKWGTKKEKEALQE